MCHLVAVSLASCLRTALLQSLSKAPCQSRPMSALLANSYRVHRLGSLVSAFVGSQMIDSQKTRSKISTWIVFVPSHCDSDSRPFNLSI